MNHTFWLSTFWLNSYSKRHTTINSLQNILPGFEHIPSFLPPSETAVRPFPWVYLIVLLWMLQCPKSIQNIHLLWPFQLGRSQQLPSGWEHITGHLQASPSSGWHSVATVTIIIFFFLPHFIKTQKRTSRTTSESGKDDRISVFKVRKRISRGG